MQGSLMFSYALSDDTIVAVSSGGGSSAVGIIRLSGAGCFDYVSGIFCSDQGQADIAECSSWRRVRGRCFLDEAVSCGCEAYVFRGPGSYTTEDMIELHLPGAQVLLQTVVEKLLNNGARLAEPGEFTARAFLNGRIDLTEAEAVCEVINSRSDGQLRCAERLLDGQLHRRCGRLSGELVDILAEVEASLDFSEEDIEISLGERLRGRVVVVLEAVKKLLAESVSWEALSDFGQVVVAGPANTGKSSLMNRLLGMNRSIVSEIAGTTRDALTWPLNLGTGECMLIDTAGLGDVDDPLGGLGQLRANRAIAGCDLLLWVIDVTEAGNPAANLPEGVSLPGYVIIVLNKIDLLDRRQDAIEVARREVGNILPAGQNYCVVAVSGLRGDNVESLKETIGDVLGNKLTAISCDEGISLTLRQRQGLEGCRDGLSRAVELWEGDDVGGQIELLALELRGGLDCLGSISGEVVTEDLLGQIFSKFCVGK
jgi:tRNA modification GTPase